MKFQVNNIKSSPCKIRGNPALLEKLADDSLDRFEAIVRVAEEGYVPANVQKRATLGKHLFTTTLSREDLKHLEEDAKVVSIALQQLLRGVV